MKSFSYIAVLLLLATACFVARPTSAAAPQQIPTVITVKKLCSSCGKKIVQKLSELPQVEEATMNLEQRTFLVRCTPNGVVSPRAVWEIVERGGEQPIKLQSPLGIFTMKPQQ